MLTGLNEALTIVNSRAANNKTYTDFFSATKNVIYNILYFVTSLLCHVNLFTKMTRAMIFIY